jgi:hypothetical protein
MLTALNIVLGGPVSLPNALGKMLEARASMPKPIGSL